MATSAEPSGRILTVAVETGKAPASEAVDPESNPLVLLGGLIPAQSLQQQIEVRHQVGVHGSLARIVPFTGGDQVEPTQLAGVHPQGFGGLVHVEFGRQTHLRRAEPPVERRRGTVLVYTATPLTRTLPLR